MNKLLQEAVCDWVLKLSGFPDWGLLFCRYDTQSWTQANACMLRVRGDYYQDKVDADELKPQQPHACGVSLDFRS